MFAENRVIVAHDVGIDDHVVGIIAPVVGIVADAMCKLVG